MKHRLWCGVLRNVEYSTFVFRRCYSFTPPKSASSPPTSSPPPSHSPSAFAQDPPRTCRPPYSLLGRPHRLRGVRRCVEYLAFVFHYFVSCSVAHRPSSHPRRHPPAPHPYTGSLERIASFIPRRLAAPFLETPLRRPTEKPTGGAGFQQCATRRGVVLGGMRYSFPPLYLSQSLNNYTAPLSHRANDGARRRLLPRRWYEELRPAVGCPQVFRKLRGAVLEASSFGPASAWDEFYLFIYLFRVRFITRRG